MAAPERTRLVKLLQAAEEEHKEKKQRKGGILGAIFGSTSATPSAAAVTSRAGSSDGEGSGKPVAPDDTELSIADIGSTTDVTASAPAAQA